MFLLSARRESFVLLLGIVLVSCPVWWAGCSSDTNIPDAGEDAWDADSGADKGDGTDEDEMKVISVDPRQGPLSGGTRVTISGKGFVDGSSVSFGANLATDVVFLSSHQVQASTPASGTPGAVSVIVSSPDGRVSSLPNGFSYVDSQNPSIGWCILQSPSTTSSKSTETTELVYGRVFVEQCTEGQNACGVIKAQLGFGTSGSDPSLDFDQWSWVDASYNPGHTDDNNDEFQAALTVENAGVYSYTYRFSVDEGRFWTYCDLDGTENGFQREMLGQLTVTGDHSGLVGWCNVQYPVSTSTVPGIPTEPIYGQVFVENCTEGEGICDSVSAELGWGPGGEDPFSDPDPSPFTWIAAEPNLANISNNDEFSASIIPQNPGEFSYVFRFTTDGGDNWAYCDLDGSSNGLQIEQMGALTVQAHDIGWCNLQFPAAIDLPVDSDTGPIYGRVFVDSCSEGEKYCGGILSQVGFGPDGMDPSVSPESFTWVDAAYNPSHTDDNNDEYSASFHVMSVGGLRYVFRFSGDAGANWKYCDLDGSENGFSEDQMGVLNVQ